MLAVAEAALIDQRTEFDECGSEIADAEMVDTEGLHTRRVDQCAVFIQVVQPGMRGGVFAGVQGSRDLAGWCSGARDQGVDKG